MAKNKGARLPKRLAGVKLPKRLRKRGDELLRMLRHPLTADVAAAALIAAATAIKDNQKPRAAAKTRDSAGDAAAGLGPSATARASRAYRDMTDSDPGAGGSRKAH